MNEDGLHGGRRESGWGDRAKRQRKEYTVPTQDWQVHSGTAVGSPYMYPSNGQSISQDRNRSFASAQDANVQQHNQPPSHWLEIGEDSHQRRRTIAEVDDLVNDKYDSIVPTFDDASHSFCDDDHATSSRSSTSREPVYERAKPPQVKKKAILRITLRIPLLSSEKASENITQKAKAELASRTTEASTGPLKQPEKLQTNRKTYIVQASDLITIDDSLYLPQVTSCLALARKESCVPKCRPCVSRVGGDTCRFRHIRAFPVERQADGDGFVVRDVAAQTCVFHHTLPKYHREPVFPVQSDLNRALDNSVRTSLMRTCAQALAPIFDDAAVHADQGNVLYRRRELDVSETCDFCSTGIFASSYLCRFCGQEYCLTCQSTMLARMKETDAVKKKNELFVCFGLHSKRPLHSFRDLVPVTRFSVEEINENLNVMRQMLQRGRDDVQSNNDAQDSDVSTDDTSIGVHDTSSNHSLKRRRKSKAVSDVPNHQATMIDQDTLNEDDFLVRWSKGEPIVVENVEGSTTEWTPDHLIEMYGDDVCHIIRCDLDPPIVQEKRGAASQMEIEEKDRWQKETTVREFFSTFSMSMEERKAVLGEGVWKLKDWPPTDSLKTAFPDIYDHFSNSVPMPDYTRRDGCKNISSFFATNANAPDLGPKMYNAWPGGHLAGQKGTTRLHMDVADAVNILLFASNAKQCNAKQKGAQWDIFRAQDADSIRQFLCEKFGSLAQGDPIHCQTHFLDDEMLGELYESKGVYSYRIVQRVNQAIFVPAGCAHQVCNLTDCIKIATDFISSQSVARCFKLTEEFRTLSGEYQQSWKADMLQLRLQLWYAWSACRLIEAQGQEEEREVKEGRSMSITIAQQLST